eukprot:1140685-Pelagomonas_calceolata.AAC.9
MGPHTVTQVQMQLRPPNHSRLRPEADTVGAQLKCPLFSIEALVEAREGIAITSWIHLEFTGKGADSSNMTTLSEKTRSKKLGLHHYNKWEAAGLPDKAVKCASSHV